MNKTVLLRQLFIVGKPKFDQSGFNTFNPAADGLHGFLESETLLKFCSKILVLRYKLWLFSGHQANFTRSASKLPSSTIYFYCEIFVDSIEISTCLSGSFKDKGVLPAIQIVTQPLFAITAPLCPDDPENHGIPAEKSVSKGFPVVAEKDLLCKNSTNCPFDGSEHNNGK